MLGFQFFHNLLAVFWVAGSNDTEEDRVLLKACLNGDKKGWDDFVDRYNRLVYHAINKTLAKYSIPVKNDFVEDIFQSFFVSIFDNNFQKLRSFGGRSTFSSWIFAVAVNHTKDKLRESSFRKGACTTSIDEAKITGIPLIENLSDPRPEPYYSLEEKERLEAIRKAMNELTDRERLLMSLHYDKEMSLHEVADLMSTNINNIYQIKNRITHKLSNFVKKFYKESVTCSSN